MTTPYQSYWGKGLRYSNGFGKDFFSDLKDIAVDIWHIATGKVSKVYSNAYGTDTVADLKDMGVTFIHMLQTNIVLLLALVVLLVVSWQPLYQVITQAAQKPASAAPISAPVIVPSQTETLAPTAVPTSTPTVIPSPTVSRFDNEYGDKYWVTEKDLLEKFIPELNLNPSISWGYVGGGFTGDFGCWGVIPWPRVRSYDTGYNINGKDIFIYTLDSQYYDGLHPRPISPEYITGEFKIQIPDIGAPEQ